MVDIYFIFHAPPFNYLLSLSISPGGVAGASKVLCYKLELVQLEQSHVEFIPSIAFDGRWLLSLPSIASISTLIIPLMLSH